MHKIGLGIMKPRSAKNKGKGFQNKVRDLMLEYAEDALLPDDIISNPMGNPGEDIILSPAARRFYPWNVECKSKASIAACRFIEQAASHYRASHGERDDIEPVAIFKENKSKANSEHYLQGEPMAICRLRYLLELISLMHWMGRNRV